MRIVCIHRNKLVPLLRMGADIQDLTPDGLGDTPYHLVSMTSEQLEAVQGIYGEAASQEMEDITPRIVTRELAKAGGFLHCRGGRIPNGTRLRARYRGRDYEAEVKGGKVWFNQKPYDSPSQAARAVTGSQTNGWKFWEYCDSESGRWHRLSRLRDDNDN